MFITLIVIAALAVYVLFSYNKLVAMKEVVKVSKAAISVQLDARGKKFDSLIATVNKIMTHETELFTQIAKLRSGVVEAKSIDDTQTVRKLEDELTKIVSSGKINIAVENYPEMKSDRNMMILQEEIISSENILSSAKSGYNRAVEKYKAVIQQVPDVFIVKLFPQLLIDDEYWVLAEEEIKTQEEKRVDFD